MSGSDDFNVYMWEVPKVDKNYEGIMKVNKSFLVLRGHRSIVNQVCFNKHTSMLCTAGVEKMVKVRKSFEISFLHYDKHLGGTGKVGVGWTCRGGVRVCRLWKRNCQIKNSHETFTTSELLHVSYRCGLHFQWLVVKVG